VLVSEPSEAEALACLRGLRQRYELHHGVAFSEGALGAAVACGKRWGAAACLLRAGGPGRCWCSSGSACLPCALGHELLCRRADGAGPGAWGSLQVRH
jgi:hypothetical protein